VLDEFDDRYIVTLGAKVSKKEVRLEENGSPIQMDITVWDIMGARGFRELLREAYFHGAQGILAVCDCTRQETLDELDAWVEAVFKTIGEVPVVMVANKRDLERDSRFGPKEVATAAEAFGCPYHFTSAKTGENVETVFRDLAAAIAQKVVA
jgi:small GTP-binding protein